MTIFENRDEFRDKFDQLIGEYIKHRHCPHCDKETTMLVVNCYSMELELVNGTYFLRCMRCLKLFEPTLTEVKEEVSEGY